MEEIEMDEWEIVEYIYTIGEDDEKKSKLGWILDTGLSLGKKVVITGVVVSSIPILVPPLVVISALGCALSLPFGFVFASYACTEKLMRKLLPDPSPPPPPPLLLDHGYDDEEIYDRKQEEEGEYEEEKQMEAVKDDVEMRIELVDDCYPEKVQVGDELIGESEEKPSSFDLVGPGDMNTDYDKKTDDCNVVAAPEDMKFQGQAGDLEVEVDNKLTESEGRRGKEAEKAEKVNEKLTTPPPSKDKGSKGKNVHYSKDTERRGKRKTSGALKFSRKKKELIIDEKTDQKKLLPGPVGDDKVVVQESVTGVSSDDKEQSGEQRGVMLGSELNNDAKQVPEESNKEQIVGDVKDVDVVAISEAVADVIDKKIELHSVTIYSDPAGENNEARIVTDDGGLKHDKGKIAEEEVKKEKDGVVDGGAQSGKGLFGEDEKIWKKMEAIRAIVGYKGPKGDSYMEELKALYLFTGIEPPVDSADFQNKLCFLMSVIGLK